ncbi:MAG: glycosyltransferase, partial [Muribaculaceae bacterium]|nr:glycosyltransferase [Muribaculaceae bacterium]
MNFDINIDPLVWICLAVAALASLLAFWTRFIPIWYAGSAVDTTTYDSASDSDFEESSEDQGEPDYETGQEEEEAEPATVNVDSWSPAADSYPKLSVIVYAYTEFEETKKYLEMLMSQDYPNFEVILINEGSADTLGILQEQVGTQYDNLYITFIPHD